MDSVKIMINDLPLRPRKLSQDALEAVFGGCKGSGSSCGGDKDCCDKGVYGGQLKCVAAMGRGGATAAGYKRAVWGERGNYCMERA